MKQKILVCLNLIAATCVIGSNSQGTIDPKTLGYACKISLKVAK